MAEEKEGNRRCAVFALVERSRKEAVENNDLEQEGREKSDGR